jgi:Protein of unknown function (DUF3710)
MPGRRRERRTPQSKLDATPPWPTRERPPADTTTGPYDVADRPDDGKARVDLGALLIPAVPGFELRLDLTEDQQVISVTIANSSGHMQLGAFAAPRSQGIWDEIQPEIVESVRSQGGSVKVREDGPFGTELAGTLKVDGRSSPVRFIGVDGPRWFLRAMLVGTVANDAAKARVLETALRDVVVVRGSDPFPVREPLPLRLPVDTLDAAGAEGDAGDADDDLGGGPADEQEQA